MIVVVIIESVVLVVLTVFVAGLLTSYGGLHQRLDELERLGVAPRESAAPGAAETPGAGASEPGGQRVERHPARPGLDLRGVTPEGDAVAVAVVGVRHRTLLAFLSSGCTTCARFWEQLGSTEGVDLPPGVRLVVVTKGPDQESPSAVAGLAGPGVEPLMSTEAWREYEVPGNPWFVFVDGPSGLVKGEGTALEWPNVLELMTLASGDLSLVTGEADPPGKAARDVERERAIDRVLLDAGIVPGHPSLYPTTVQAAGESPEPPDAPGSPAGSVR